MFGLRRRIAIICAKCVNMAIRKFSNRKGSVLPGYVAQWIDPDILPEMAELVREKIIVIMGTNGKTTTNSMICHALRAEGKKVLINRTGANMLNGVISAFVLAAGSKGRLDIDYACIEVDEFASMQILPKLKPDFILLTNIFRDQIDRFGEIDIVCERIQDAIAQVPEVKLISNCDDILSYALASRCGHPIVTYGIDQQIFDDISSPEVRESIFCPSCGEKLRYDFFHYGQLGIYKCPHCGWKRPAPDYTAENIAFREKGYAFEIDGMPINSKAKGPYNVYNTLSAYASIKAMGAPSDHFKEAVESFNYENNREETFTIHGTQVCLHLAKNPVGFQQKISMVLKDLRPKDIIVQINDAAQDGKDISWLWDVDFQYLSDANARTIGVAGTRSLDMALRLKYDDIPCRLVKDMESYIQRLSKEGTGRLYIIVNYSGLRRANRMLHKMQDAIAGQPNPPAQTGSDARPAAVPKPSAVPSQGGRKSRRPSGNRRKEAPKPCPPICRKARDLYTACQKQRKRAQIRGARKAEGRLAGRKDWQWKGDGMQ